MHIHVLIQKYVTENIISRLPAKNNFSFGCRTETHFFSSDFEYSILIFYGPLLLVIKFPSNNSFGKAVFLEGFLGPPTWAPTGGKHLGHLKGAHSYLFNFFFQTFRDVSITIKLVFFSYHMTKFTAEKCSVWKIVVKTCLDMVTIIKLKQ